MAKSIKNVLSEELIANAKEKIELGQNLINQLAKFKSISGLDKTQRQIRKEVLFLQNHLQQETLKEVHVKCSNLVHFQFLLNVLLQQRDVLHVDFNVGVAQRSMPLRVDIVCENGQKWIKVIARNAKALLEAARGDTDLGTRNIVEQAEEFMYASEQHFCMFENPKVVFYFKEHIAEELQLLLMDMGIEVAMLAENSDNIIAEHKSLSTLNLDITTLLAYVCNLCNGSTNFVFAEPILTQQAADERKVPLKPILDVLFKDKRLICCKLAKESFMNIVNLLGGEAEKARAQQLLQRIEILPDIEEFPAELLKLRLSSRLSERSLKVFAFGIKMKAMTVTSNKAFVSSVKSQGIDVPVFVHQARALTEQKQLTAQLITTASN